MNAMTWAQLSNYLAIFGWINPSALDTLYLSKETHISPYYEAGWVDSFCGLLMWGPVIRFSRSKLLFFRKSLKFEKQKKLNFHETVLIYYAFSWHFWTADKKRKECEWERVCVCVKVRERARERERVSESVS